VPVRYRTILMDPPWHETGGGKIKRGADRHYPVVTDKRMLGVIQSCPDLARASEDCHCWIWVTNNRLPLGLRIMEALGFRYVTNAAWVKDRQGGDVTANQGSAIGHHCSSWQALRKARGVVPVDRAGLPRPTTRVVRATKARWLGRVGQRSVPRGA